jgi:hypothetical protein
MVTDNRTSNAPDQYISRSLGAENLSLSCGGQARGTEESKDVGFHTPIKTKRFADCFAATGFS